MVDHFDLHCLLVRATVVMLSSPVAKVAPNDDTSARGRRPPVCLAATGVGLVSVLTA